MAAQSCTADHWRNYDFLASSNDSSDFRYHFQVSKGLSDVSGFMNNKYSEICYVFSLPGVQLKNLYASSIVCLVAE